MARKYLKKPTPKNHVNELPFDIPKVLGQARKPLADIDWDYDDEAFQIEVPDPSTLPPPTLSLTSAERQHFREMLVELASRRKESLRLYRPFPMQEDFHRSRAGIRLIRGGNRGGKTLGSAVEVARALTRADPHDKYPKYGRAIFVGKDLKHCGEVMYRKLFKGGDAQNCPFWIIKDEDTDEWRAYHPEMDGHRKHERVPAPPLIPSRFIKNIGWENKKEEIPKKVNLTTGWEISFFSGEGEPPQGWNVHLIWMDEEIPHPKWFSEMVPRLVDEHGVLIWSATPQAGTHHLFELSGRAADTKDDPNARVQEFFVNIFSNTYIDEEARQTFIEDMSHDEDEYRVRVEGDFAIAGMRIYPEFAYKRGGIHRCESFVVPDDWTREVAVDPGRQVAAALFLAIPPPHSEWSKYEAIVYAEAYVKKCNASMFAKAVKSVAGEHWIHRWLIDGHASRMHEIGSGKTVDQQYSEAFLAEGMKQNGFTGFQWASDDVDGGILLMKSKLQVYDGMPRWVFMSENLRWFCWEAERYANQKLSKVNIVTDKPVKRHDHLMDCGRYLASSPLRYVTPPRHTKVKESWSAAYLKKKRERKIGESKASGGICVF